MPQASPTEARLRVPGDRIAGLLGERDALLRLVEQGFPRARIIARGDEVRISADERTAGMVKKVFEELLVLIGEGQRLHEERGRRGGELGARGGRSPGVGSLLTPPSARGAMVFPRGSSGGRNWPIGT